MTSFSENDGLDRRQSVLSTQRCAASQALLADRGALGWSTATGTYGQFVDHPSNLSVSASGMLRSSTLHAAGRCGGLDNASQLSLRIKGELAAAADGLKYAGRSPLKTRIEARQLMPRHRISTCARLRKEIQYCNFLSKSCLKELSSGQGRSERFECAPAVHQFGNAEEWTAKRRARVCSFLSSSRSLI